MLTLTGRNVYSESPSSEKSNSQMGLNLRPSLITEGLGRIGMSGAAVIVEMRGKVNVESPKQRCY